MSINTGNLITTEFGQQMLAHAGELNFELAQEHPGISVKLVYSYMGITQRNSDLIKADENFYYTDGLAFITNARSQIDLCQVQSYPRPVEDGGLVRKSFSISALFDIKEDLTECRNVVLLARLVYTDGRTEEQKIKDNNRSAYVILRADYGLDLADTPSAGVHFHFAYSQLLDSSGNPAQEYGISISQSRYGRSRQRIIFNYVIDDTSGISDNISIEDHVYPYSDGYLSKKAFEEGLKDYEATLQEYTEQLQNYLFGWSKIYDSKEKAISKSEVGNTFTIRNKAKRISPLHDLLDNYVGRLPDTLGERTYTTDPVSGDTFTPMSHWNATIREYPFEQREKIQIFNVSSYKNVRFKHADAGGEIVYEDKYIPVTIVFVMWLRTGVAIDQADNENTVNYNTFYSSGYHCVRTFVSIPIEEEGEPDLVRQFICDCKFCDNSTVIVPSEPVVGKIEVDDSDSSAPKLNMSMIWKSLYFRTEGATDKVYSALLLNLVQVPEVSPGVGISSDPAGVAPILRDRILREESPYKLDRATLAFNNSNVGYAAYPDYSYTNPGNGGAYNPDFDFTQAAAKEQGTIYEGGAGGYNNEETVMSLKNGRIGICDSYSGFYEGEDNKMDRPPSKRLRQSNTTPDGLMHFQAENWAAFDGGFWSFLTPGVGVRFKLYNGESGFDDLWFLFAINTDEKAVFWKSEVWKFNQGINSATLRKSVVRFGCRDLWFTHEGCPVALLYMEIADPDYAYAHSYFEYPVYLKNSAATSGGAWVSYGDDFSTYPNSWTVTNGLFDKLGIYINMRNRNENDNNFFSGWNSSEILEDDSENDRPEGYVTSVQGNARGYNTTADCTVIEWHKKKYLVPTIA